MDVSPKNLHPHLIHETIREQTSVNNGLRQKALLICSILVGCVQLENKASKPIPVARNAATANVTEPSFPVELVEFQPYAGNPLFTGQGPGHWDAMIRERGWILREDDGYHLWYTGYLGARQDVKYLGYATSPDGLTWTRHPDNPVYDDHWTEDVMVVKHNETYYMFAEGRDDVPHLLTSTDRIHWTCIGKLDIRDTNGQPLTTGPRGTPVAWLENDTWHLFYERYDKGIWLATSKDMAVWTNVQDEPIFVPGPDPHDAKAIAFNQIIKHDGRYFAYYHGLGSAPPWDTWSTSVAASPDLLNWKKYPNNPIVRDNQSSGILVHDGKQYRLYTMHPAVAVHFPRQK